MIKHIIFGIVILAAALAAMVGMAYGWAYTYNITTPESSAAISTGDDRIREVKGAIQERENVDHYWPLASSAVSDLDAGKHRQITFQSPIATPTPQADEGLLYTKTVSDKSELVFIDEDGDEIQLTSGGVLNLTAAAVTAASAAILDNSTVEQSGGILRVKDGGITGAKLATGSGCADNTTLEVNGSSKLAIKVPAVPSSGGNNYPTAIYSPVCAYGTYTGNGSSQTIKTGFTVRRAIIKCTQTIDSNYPEGCEILVTASGTFAWDQGNGSAEDVSVTGDVITLSDGGANINYNGKLYYWYAEGVRP